jgi:hypothetical protein
MADILNYILIYSLYTRIKHFNEFLHPGNIAFDIHNNRYSVNDRGVLLFSLETTPILDFIVNYSLYNLINHFNEFLDPSKHRV